MTQTDMTARLRVALDRKAGNAMALTDTERELDHFRNRLGPATRARRLRLATTAAAVAAAVAGVAIGVVTLSSGDTKKAPIGGRGARVAERLPAGTIPAGFPVGTFRHAGTFGLTKLTLTAHAKATLVDPRDDLATVMAMTFTKPNFVSFDITHLSGSTIRCDGVIGTYRYVVAAGQLTFTPVNDGCTQRSIPLSELPWGPISGG